MALSIAEMREKLIALAKECRKDPLRFVQRSFQWGKGTLRGMNGPDEWQKEQLEFMRDQLHSGMAAEEVVRMATASGHGIGKAQDVNLIVDTPDGKKRWGDLKVGDLLWGVDGKPVRIVAIPYRGLRKKYRVHFDDGSSTVCCGEHLWTVKGRQQRRNDLDWVTLSTDEIIAKGVKRSNGKALARQWEIPRYAPVEYPKADLPVDPYVIGLYLGNGCRRSAEIVTNEPEVRGQVALRGYRFAIGYKKGSPVLSMNIRGLRSKIKALGLLDCYSYEKFIPEIYKYASVEQRSELLRGLIDTDGEVAKHGTVIYDTTSPQLRDDVVWLVRSLGGKAQVQPTAKKPFYRDSDGNKVECRDCYRVTITMPRGFVIGYVKHKFERVRDTVQSRYLTRWIDRIELEGEGEVMCVTVSNPNGLYLTNDFIVTHNSCFVAWIILWAICTRPDTRGVVTANTDTQLRTKTWAELAKWYHLCVFRPWFELTATAIISKQPGHDKTWRIDAIPWSESNPEAFAGLHNQGKRILVIFDEASAIHDKIWEVIEGAMTDRDTEIFWICFGNPTRNVGRFYDCFGRMRKRWKTWHIDSRTVAISNKSQLNQWVEDYGEDSDFVKVRVRGLFPSASSNQLIPRHLVEGALWREAPEHNPMLSRVAIIGVDVARFGGDASAIAVRCGNDLFRLEKHYGLDGYELGYKVAQIFDELHAKMGFEKVYINVDIGGVGASPRDFLMHHGYSAFVTEVNFGSAADNKVKYKNKRAEMWGEMRDWLAEGSLVRNDLSEELLEDLISPEYVVTPNEQIQLESKEDIKERIGRSPDLGDACALLFATKYHIPITDNYPMSRMNERARESRNQRRW